MQIGVIGCGNVGYAFLLWLHQRGFSVVGYDTSYEVKNKIKSEIGNNSSAQSIGDLYQCDCIFICVPTEPNNDGSADMGIYESVIDELALLLKDKIGTSVVQRSTCPPGSADVYSQRFSGNISYGVNPSFLRKASIKFDTEHPDRIAIGGTGLVRQHLDIIYKGINSKRYITDSRTSVELLKYIENTIDALLISYWNEILRYAKSINLEPIELIKIIEQIGDREKFQTVSRIPGKAFGLWCLPKDINALVYEMKRKSIKANVLEGVISTNLEFENEIGIGMSPAQSLWEISDGDFHVLQDGYNQILSYYLNHGRGI